MKIRTLASIFIVSLLFSNPLFGILFEADEDQPALYYADSQTYDRDLGLLILKGHVEFEYGGNVLEADYVTYNEQADLVTASGNVRLRQPDGSINFADYVELTGDMKKGVILQIKTLLKDDSKIAALEGRKYEDREELDQAVYTPCKLCGDKPPTWQINARRAIKDNVNNDIDFTDAEFRLFDVPLFYVPYATQPLERRTGVLIPKPSFTSDFGAGLTTPYYIVLSDSDDMTIAPTFFTKQAPLLEGQYRKAFGRGIFKIDGSITEYKLTSSDKRREKQGGYNIPTTRGYVYGTTKININDIWRFQGAGGYVSDKTFFKKYKYSGWQNEPALTSKGILEGFLNQRDYAAGKVYYFQGLQNTDKQSQINSPLPLLEYSAYSGLDPLGGRFTFDGNLLNLYRESTGRMQRGIGIIGWKRPLIIPSGQVFTAFGSARGDLYKLEQYSRNRDGGARFFPQAGIDWRWPFVNSPCQAQSVIIQPMGQLIAAPDKALGVKASDIPNEDSVDFAFNDANLFSPDRFPGYDLIDTGSRAVYGGEFLTTGPCLGDIEFFIGQNYTLSKPSDIDSRGSNGNGTDSERRLLRQQGLNQRFSDYVGRLEASPYDWLTLNYRFRLDRKNFQQRVAEVGGKIGPSLARLSANYVYISKRAGTINNRNFNQIDLKFSSAFTKYWTLVGLYKQNLNSKSHGGGPLEHGAGLIYRDDCFALGVTAKKQYYKDRDLRPATVFMLTLYLKNIGDFSHNYNLDNGITGDQKDTKSQPF